MTLCSSSQHYAASLCTLAFIVRGRSIVDHPPTDAQQEIKERVDSTQSVFSPYNEVIGEAKSLPGTMPLTYAKKKSCYKPETPTIHMISSTFPLSSAGCCLRRRKVSGAEQTDRLNHPRSQEQPCGKHWQALDLTIPFP